MQILIRPSDLGVCIYPWYEAAPHIKTIEQLVLNLFQDDFNNHLIIQLPVRFGKTFYTQTLLPLALLIQNPDERIIIASHSSSFSSESVARVRDLIALHGMELRGLQLDPSWQGKDYFRIKGHLGECRAVGVGSKFPGASGTTILCDDCYGDQSEANSPSIRKSVETWWSGTLMARKTPNPAHPPKVILCQTPRHPEDISLMLEASNEDLPPEEKWSIHRLPAIKDDIPLWDHFPKERLDNIKLQYEARGDGHLFHTLFLCDPQLNPEGGFPPSYLTGLFYDKMDSIKNYYKIMAIDPNVGTGSKKGDYGCILYAIYNKDNGDIWIEDCYLSKNSYDQLEDAAVQFLINYKPDGCMIETNSAFRVVADNINNKCHRSGFAYPPIYNKISTENKVKRIDVILSPILRNKKLHIKDMVSTRLGMLQLRAFPQGKNDDFVDTIYLLTQIAAELDK